MSVDPSWVLALMLKAQPHAPWSNTYESTAEAIAKAAEMYPSFGGDDGPARTAAWLVSLGFFEGALKQDAVGDCHEKNDKGMCLPGAVPHSFCMFQINETNHQYLGVTKNDLLTDINVCAQSAAKLMQQSFRMCKASPLEERLRWYAGGGPVCTENEDAGRKSRHRALKGVWLFSNVKTAKAKE